ncbi:MAG: FHA domain-containing protein, partial [Myxococcota bacterium]
SAPAAARGWKPGAPVAGVPPESGAGGVPPTVVTSAPGAPAAVARLVAILKDGSDGAIHPLVEEQVDVGRAEGDILLEDDPYLSPRHARIRRRGDTFVLQDLDSTNGVYVRIRNPVDLNDGDMILIGQEVLRFDTLPDGELPLGPATVHGVMLFGTPDVPRVARLTQYTTEGVGRDVHYLYRDETVLGREIGDIVFTDDPFLSRRHASVTIDRANRRFVLRDLGSSNGTALRVRGEHVLEDGDQFRMGRHLFRFDRVRASGGRQPQR